jgi:HK97 family phage portal protein
MMNMFFGGQSYTGKQVTEESALTYTAVYAAVRILAETIASIPLHVYIRVGEDGKKRARGHPLYNILHNQPNTEMTAFSFWEVMMFGLLFHGNCYAEIESDSFGDVTGLWPLLPQNMKVDRLDGEIIYLYTLPEGKTVPIKKEQIFHVHGLSSNGLCGFSPLQMAREAIGLGLAAEEFGARFFSNGGNVSGVLEHPTELGDEGRDNLRRSFEETYSGLSRAHRLMILEEGMKYVRIGIPPNEAQFLETRKFQVTEIARFFRVPPHMLADLERSTNNNIEHQSLEFVKFSIIPWGVRIEQTILWKLFSAQEKKYMFAEFSLEGLLRGDIKSRFEALHIARLDGIITADEWRAMENMNPLTPEQLAKTWRPVNMVPADTPVAIQDPSKGGEPTK